MPRVYMIPKQKRDKMIKDTIQSLERGTPDDVLLKKLITETGYSLSGAQKMLSEAKLFAEKKQDA